MGWSAPPVLARRASGLVSTSGACSPCVRAGQHLRCLLAVRPGWSAPCGACSPCVRAGQHLAVLARRASGLVSTSGACSPCVRAGQHLAVLARRASGLVSTLRCLLAVRPGWSAPCGACSPMQPRSYVITGLSHGLLFKPLLNTGPVFVGTGNELCKVRCE